ncbi:MAG TPA: CpsD/CapB family tyrosine-protein kinase [Anaerolineae bacterium]|jgi:capsular exopolysaccharide synthesis family protein|nr:CpsD/CapB family tyrosine-protein kinase [Anaerolineae bacterium]
MTANLITITDPRSATAEAYRRLRTNLEFTSLDQPLRTLLVTSAGPDAGKSTMLANLAVSMAQSGRRVILVDSDLHQPRLHEIFGLDNRSGLTTIVGRSSDELPLQETGVKGLRVLPAGPLPDIPADLIGSPAMETLIASLREQADIVLFDTSPVVSVTDAAVLASKVDGVLLVVNAGRTRREHAQRAKAMLERVNARVVGAVLTNAPHDADLLQM